MVHDLSSFWAQHQCTIIPAYDVPMGAATSHPAVVYNALRKKPSNIAFFQPCRRPSDGRYGDNPCRLQKFHQFQVLMRPEPGCVQELVFQSYAAMGIDLRQHDIKFVEDDWESPSLGAVGIGWEVWLDGTETTQVTYLHQMGGVDCPSSCIELAYGIERIALFLQNVPTMMDLCWHHDHNGRDLFYRQEQELSRWAFDHAPTDGMMNHFDDHIAWGNACVDDALILPAYEHSMHANHIFNVLDARGSISVSDRAAFIGRIRKLVERCSQHWINES